MTHPAVVECAITGVPDEIRGQVVKATIVLARDYKEKAGEALIKELQDHVKRVTAPYKYPPRHRVRRRAAQDHRRQDQAQAHPPDRRHSGIEEIQASDASRRESVGGDRGRLSLPSATTAGRGHSR